MNCRIKTAVTVRKLHLTVSKHILISIGSKLNSATAHTSHFIGGKVQFLTEMVLVEVLSPSMDRTVDENVFNLKLLSFI